MHGRPISKDDELLLYVEMRRLMPTIEVTNNNDNVERPPLDA